MANKLLLTFVGSVVWLLAHRYGQLYMGEATLLLLGIAGAVHMLTPEDFHPTDCIALISGGVLLGGITRLLV